ncbi:MAG: twin-arginine translocase subunit TatC [Pseudomonadales bacterium]|nr:twin-arginine translocase subunit TatC [Pseudomonadales bacterium]
MSDGQENLAEGTLMSHLLELRDRLIRAVFAVLIACLPCFYFANDLFELVADPLVKQLPKGAVLQSTSVVGPFMTPFKLAFFVGLFVAMPYVLYQIWAFVAPGLYRKEKRFALPLLVSSIVLFYTGALFAYWAVFPIMFGFFANTAPANVMFNPDISQYLDFVLTIFFAFGLAFEMPIAVVLLAITGIVSIDKLRNNRGYVAIGISIVAAILTPPDGITLIIMAVPMYLLYEGGLFFARVMIKARGTDVNKRKDEEAEA